VTLIARHTCYLFVLYLFVARIAHPLLQATTIINYNIQNSKCIITSIVRFKQWNNVILYNLYSHSRVLKLYIYLHKWIHFYFFVPVYMLWLWIKHLFLAIEDCLLSVDPIREYHYYLCYRFSYIVSVSIYYYVVMVQGPLLFIFWPMYHFIII